MIDRILLRQELWPNYSAVASAKAASVEITEAEAYLFTILDPFAVLFVQFFKFFYKTSAKTQKLLQNTSASALTEASAEASDSAVQI